jgi:hypothetical protein
VSVVPWIDVAEFAYQAGFRSDAHATAVAISEPESGRETTAHNASDPNGGSFGLMQINGVHDPNGSGVAPNIVPTAAWVAKMYDPLENMREAYAVWMRAGRSFAPWGTFKYGLHKPYVVTAKVALDARSRLAASATKLASAQTALASLQATSAGQVATIDSLAAQVAALQAYVQSLETGSSETSAELAAARVELASLIAKINAAMEALS